ncbi:CHASE domain-containing protein [Shewanella acanthi]|uniref:CHASE domain-containing protein n=1 Tax=Shewanella acanthi TaxID=2864212 RepID=UPI001C65C207|nr:CHASE domain-containing protein [Shewanella acanthi]QYJ77460.1 CHASE domain-containing protein [Shewanella acanthi]
MINRIFNRINTIVWWAPLLIGLFLTTCFASLLHYQNQIDNAAHVRSLANEAEQMIIQRFELFQYGLRGARGAVIAAGVNQITRGQFEDYMDSRDIDSEFSGALGFGFIRRVPMAEEAAFVEAARLDGAPNFKIKTLNPHDGDRFVIQYIYPIARNQQAVGLDIGSESNRRNAALNSARENKARITAPITLVQANKKARRGVLIMLPIYASNVPLDTPEQREAQVKGWSYAPLVVDDVLADLNNVMGQAQIVLVSKLDNDTFFSTERLTNTAYFPTEQVSRDIRVFGQQWTLILVPNSLAFEHQRWNIPWIVTLGLTLTFVCIFVLNLITTRAVKNVDESQEIPRGVKSMGLFLRSDTVKRSWPSALCILILIFCSTSWLILDKEQQTVSIKLRNSAKAAISAIEDTAKKYSEDAIFLANTPPIQELRDFQHQSLSSISAADKSWRDSLADIFKAYMLTTPDIFQVRLITAESGWHEQVKIQREGDELVRYEDKSLQNKSHEPYIKDTLRFAAGGVYMSNINLNREHGSIEYPERPVWRFSTPIFYDDGEPLGIIIINISALPFIKGIINDNSAAVTTYLTNADDEFIYHPDPSKMFVFEQGKSYRWQDEFQPVSSINIDVDNSHSFTSHQGRIWEQSQQFNMESATNPRVINLHSTVSQLPTLISVGSKILLLGLLLFILAFISSAVQYWLWLTTLVAEKDKWNAQLRHQQEKETLRFKGLIESSPEATLIVDQYGLIKMVNTEAEKMFGYTREQLENYSIERLIPSELRHHHATHIKNYTANPKTRRMGATKDLFAINAEGTEFPVEISLSAVSMENEMLVSVSVRNITERLDIERKLRTALEDAEQATQAKSAFLANTSHEIRTPLNAIIGLTHLLSNENLTEAQRRIVEKISLSGKSLLGIVNDVLDLSKIEANEMMLEPLPLELKDFLDEIGSIFSIQAETKNLHFALHLSQDLPLRVNADAIRLRQILVNLLSNALKFTSLGEITLSAEVVADLDDKESQETTTRIRFTVTDTGIGITASAQERLFNPFSQADISTTRRFGGTGLGLSIVQKLVFLMQGTLGVDSTDGKGSQFWVELPFDTNHLEETSLPEHTHQSLYVMIAEDNSQDAQVLQSLTRSLGWRADIVPDGKALLELFTSRLNQNLRLPDALLVDWQMPNLDGIKALKALIQTVGRENLPAVLMVSAHDRNQIAIEDTQHLIGSILQKPVNPSTLFNAVNEVVSQHTGLNEKVLHATATDAIKAKWLPDVRVLVVDDSETNLEVAAYILNQTGAIAATASSGKQAIQKMEMADRPYDAVLMDVQMPEMDGLEATRYIRETLGHTKLPIIALTAGALVEERRRALTAGMDDFLTKPISPSRLISVLRSQIARSRGHELAIEELKPTANDESEWPSIEGLNSERAQELLLGNKELFYTTLRHLLEENSNLTAELIEDIDEPDNQALRLSLAAQVHKMRSAAGMIGSEIIHTLATDAERQLREDNSQSYGTLSKLISALSQLTSASKDSLQEWDQSIKQTLTENASQLSEQISQETLNHLLQLLSDQDLSVLDLVEQHRESLLVTLGANHFEELLDSLRRLNFKQAKTILEAPIKRTGTVNE